MKRHPLYLAMAITLLAAGSASAQQTDDTSTTTAPIQRANVSSTSNTTTSNDTKRVQQMTAVKVQAKADSLGGGLMTEQSAAKAVSTISRDAIEKMGPGNNFTQMIQSIPGVNASTDDVTGLADGNYSIRGFSSNEVGTTVNGAPINDSGSYQIYATEYGDSENVGDITVLQGIPDVDMPDAGAAGGHIAWATIDPTHKAGLDFTQTVGSHDYRRTFIRLNTGDTGPVRSWLSYSDNSADKWRGNGDMKVTKVDGKSIWTIDNENSISASLQYNRQVKDSYFGVGKADVAKHGYFYDYDTSFVPGSRDTNYYGLHTNPFSSLLVSLDGEFTFSDSLRLSVVPYFQYGDGGSGSGSNFFVESTTATHTYESANQDLNGDGKIINGTKALAYGFSYSTTYRPGVIAKLNQDLTADNSLEYGVWYENARQEQGQSFGLANQQTGQPNDLWASSNFITYANGATQKAYDEDTNTETKKVFVTDTWTPSDQWTITGGAAYLHVDRQGSAIEFPNSFAGSVKFQQIGNTDIDVTYHKVTPTLGVKFSPDDKNQFFYGIGKSFRSPPNTAVFLNTVVGRDPNKPESAWNNDLGWRYYGDNLAVSTMLYRSNFNNKTEAGFDQATGESFYTQIDKLKMQGFDAEASYKFADVWKVYGSYTYTQAKIESNLNTGDDGIYPTAGKTLTNTPRNIGYTEISYDNGSFWASLTGKYRSSIFGDYMNTERAGGYTTFGINAGFRFADFSEYFRSPYIKINLDNITDRHAFSNDNNGSSFLASNPNKIKDVNGVTLFSSAPYYSLLEPRTFMVTIGASFF